MDYFLVVQPAKIDKQPKKVRKILPATLAAARMLSKPLDTELQTFSNSKRSNKQFGAVCAFAANTNVGVLRKVNEDRIGIILNVV